MHWQTIANGGTIGTRGSECGIIVRDEELGGDARITLERGGSVAPLSITCGIYGWMAHTRFFASTVEVEREFDLMKAEIEAIVQTCASPLREEGTVRDVVVEAIAAFVARFP